VAANGVIGGHFRMRVWPRSGGLCGRPAMGQNREVAQGLGTTLPAEADSKALNDFLLARSKRIRSLPDLSLTVVKLMGRASTCW